MGLRLHHQGVRALGLRAKVICTREMWPLLQIGQGSFYPEKLGRVATPFYLSNLYVHKRDCEGRKERGRRDEMRH